MKVFSHFAAFPEQKSSYLSFFPFPIDEKSFL